MSEPFIGEVRMFGGNFAPEGWAFCEGNIIAIVQSQALFSIIGAYYGGDGRTTFGLPDMRDRVVIGAGTGPGLTPRSLGQKMGASTVTLTQEQLPTHIHAVDHTEADFQMKVINQNGVNHQPQNNDHIGICYGDETQKQADWYSESDDNLTYLGGVSASGSVTVAPAGGGLSHNNEQPVQGVNYIIALTGYYPPRP